MKYRRLRRDELTELEPQFVRFLAAQGIPAEEWARIKVADEPRAEVLVDQFSAMVFDDVLRRLEYAELRTRRQLLAFRATAERLEVRGVVIAAESDDHRATPASDPSAEGLDFRQNLPPDQMMARMQASGVKLKLLSAERAYRPDRASDLFALLESGARIAKTSELFDLLDGLSPGSGEASADDGNGDGPGDGDGVPL